MDWFERLTGFREAGYAQTGFRLELDGDRLRSKVNGCSYAIGELELVSLAELRTRVAGASGPAGQLRFTNVAGDVRKLHRQADYAGALFQVASQFNLLEMVSPGVTPEDGVTRYAHDHTQGPACAVAAGAATIFRNYFAPVGDQLGQTAQRQLDGLADLGAALAQSLGRPVAELWTMQNGYAFPSADGLQAIASYLRALDEPGLDALRGRLRIGVHRDVEVTDGQVTDGELPGPIVSQAFCSALPISYARLPRNADWRPFATLVLEAAYEATLLEAVANARRGASYTVLLTRLGGGVFGNEDRWIDVALVRALNLMQAYDLDVRMVSYGAVPAAMARLATEWKAEPGEGVEHAGPERLTKRGR